MALPATLSGGLRWGEERVWLLCPAHGCGRRVALLYIGGSGIFALSPYVDALLALKMPHFNPLTDPYTLAGIAALAVRIAAWWRRRAKHLRRANAA